MQLKWPATSDWMPGVVGTSITLAFIGMFSALLQLPIPPANQSTVYLLAGGLLSMANQVIGYYFGSSAGSAKKDAAISTALVAAAPVVPSTTTITTQTTKEAP